MRIITLLSQKIIAIVVVLLFLLTPYSQKALAKSTVAAKSKNKSATLSIALHKSSPKAADMPRGTKNVMFAAIELKTNKGEVSIKEIEVASETENYQSFENIRILKNAKIIGAAPMFKYVNPEKPMAKVAIKLKKPLTITPAGAIVHLQTDISTIAKGPVNLGITGLAYAKNKKPIKIIGKLPVFGHKLNILGDAVDGSSKAGDAYLYISTDDWHPIPSRTVAIGEKGVEFIKAVFSVNSGALEVKGVEVRVSGDLMSTDIAKIYGYDEAGKLLGEGVVDVYQNGVLAWVAFREPLKVARRAVVAIKADIAPAAVAGRQGGLYLGDIYGEFDQIAGSARGNPMTIAAQQ